MTIDKINGINRQVYIPYPLKTKSKNKGYSCNTNSSTGIYPVYGETPYGINKRPYIKTDEYFLPAGDKVCVYKLINGQTVVIAQKESGCPIIKTVFKVGALDEPEGKEGISHFIEHSIFHESKKYGDVEQKIKDIGAYYNACTTNNHTEYYIKLNNNDKKAIQSALDIEADMLFNPKFSKLDKEKRIVIKESKQAETEEIGILKNMTVKNMFTIKKPDIDDILTGNEKTINSITRDDMIKYHNEYYIPSNSVTTIVSQINPDEVIEMTAKSFLEASKDIKNNEIKRKQYPLLNNMVRNDLISKESDRKQILFNFLIPDVSIEDKIKYYAICEWFAKNSNFTAVFNNEYNRNLQLLLLYNGNNEDEYNVFEKLKEEIIRLSKEQISEFQLDKIKKSINESFEKDYKDNESITSNLADMYVNKEYPYYVQKNIINNLKSEDIINFAKNIDFNKSVMSVLHPKGTTNEDLKNGMEKYKNYIAPVIVPKTIYPINIENYLTNYDISPYYSEKVVNAILPDNTNLTLLNSKSDKCSVYWEISNPDLNSFNPAVKYIMEALPSKVVKYLSELKNKYDINIDYNFLESGKFSLSVDCPKDKLNLALKELKKCFDVEFEQDNFEQVKQKVSDILKDEANKEGAQDIFFEKKFGINLGLDKKNMVDEIENITLNDLKTYYNALLTNSGSNIVVMAPLEKNKEMINDIASNIYIPGLMFKPNKEIKKVYDAKSIKKCYIKEKNQPYYAVIYTFKNNGNKEDSLKFQLLSKILDDHLYKNLREKMGYAYSVGASSTETNDIGMIKMSIKTNLTDSKDINKIFTEFDKEIKTLISEGVDDKELQEAKNKLKMNITDISSDTDNLLKEIISNDILPNGLYQMQNNINIIDSITPEDIRKTAGYVFKDSPDYIIEADKNTIDKNYEYFKGLAEIVKK